MLAVITPLETDLTSDEKSRNVFFGEVILNHGQNSNMASNNNVEIGDKTGGDKTRLTTKDLDWVKRRVIILKQFELNFQNIGSVMLMNGMLN